MSIRVQIADDHPLTLIGIHTLLENRANLDVVAQAHSVEALLENLQRHPCDLLLTDLMMPGGEQVDGIRLIRRLRTLYPQLAIVVVTMLDNPALISSVLKLGIQGLVSKRGLLNDLPKAVAASPRAPFVSASIQHLLDSSAALHGKPLLQPEQLSAREVEVLRLYGTGMSIGAIALHLCRSKQTISTQKSSAMRKLGLDTSASLFLYIQEHGLS
ncbi:two-component system capsular synthesis response regulator RcsB [Pseudomonas protegens]|uniref:response regulator transcription factor n=1 Tax=Pseudomonas TaxID=286 RepID=UPI0008070214|nr:response regulator transcription factor [Pseudomonas protegens]MBF0642996.1 response regulator transcription factor [Pseudomonas protegens]MDS9873237.1 response regulator transcription factor [Pseudomonas protegens]MDT3420032.1 two-component system capsular synthesis response regulator RcsB [Pseudomonas protegens]NTZ74466.1 response regulator transcription factor [Pseudomonas protegens]OBZ22258.1 DNA-binding response regulator [Pseudomonas protegens]